MRFSATLAGPIRATQVKKASMEEFVFTDENPEPLSLLEQKHLCLTLMVKTPARLGVTGSQWVRVDSRRFQYLRITLKPERRFCNATDGITDVMSPDEGLWPFEDVGFFEYSEIQRIQPVIL